MGASSRLVLSTVGIKSPLDVGDAAEAAGAGDTAPIDVGDAPIDVGDAANASIDAARDAADRPSAVPAPAHRRAPAQPEAPAWLNGTGRSAQPSPFYASGRPVQTSIALDAERASLLDELARAAGVSVNALAVAALHAGVPAAPDDARAVIVDERVSRAGLRGARIERNLRLPEHLRARIDELTSAARGRLPRATRADLVNAALRRGLPSDAEGAARLVAEHARRLERAAAG